MESRQQIFHLDDAYREMTAERNIQTTSNCQGKTVFPSLNSIRTGVQSPTSEEHLPKRRQPFVFPQCEPGAEKVSVHGACDSEWQRTKAIGSDIADHGETIANAIRQRGTATVQVEVSFIVISVGVNE